MTLSDVRCRKATCPDDKKQIKLSDERGLYLLVNQRGGKYWRLDYRYLDKRKTLSVGVYPEVGLKEARGIRDLARQQLRDGRDPVKERRQQTQNSFAAISVEWMAMRRLELDAGTVLANQRRLDNHILPHLGDIPVAKIRASDVLAMLQSICKKGVVETAHRCRSLVGQVLRYAIVTGRAESDPTMALKGAIQSAKHQAMPTMLDPVEIGCMLRKMESYSGTAVVRIALQIAILTFARPGNVRAAEWREINWDKSEWIIPAEKMKMKDRGDHVVTLSDQAIELLEELKPITGHGGFIFPSVRSPINPISENTLNHALRRMGIDKNRQVAHGFRAMARTLLAEQGWEPEYIERQLAHIEQNKVTAAYNRAEHLIKRKEMMQAWADYLDELKAG